MKKIDPKKHPKLVKVLNKVITVGNIILKILLVIFVVVFGISVVRSCSSDDSSSVETVTASAAEVYPFDYVNYEFENLFPYPYVESSKTYRGIRYDDYGDGRIHIVGTSTGNSSFILVNNFAEVPFVNGQSYSFSSGFLGTAPVSFVIFYYTDAGTPVYKSEGTFTWSSSYTFGQFYVQVAPNTTVDTVLCPMLVKGNTPRPFIPNLNGVYNAGFSAGGRDGYNSGYSEGLVNGESLAQYGYFFSLKFVGVIQYTDGTSFSFVSNPVSATLYNGGASAASLYNFVNSTVSESGKTFSNLQWGFVFGTTMNNAIPLPSLSLGIVAPEKYFILNGSVVASYQSTVYYSGYRYDVATRFDYDDNLESYRISFSTTNLPSNISTVDFQKYGSYLGTLNFNTTDLSDLLNFTFIGNGINAGYYNGYNVGLIDGQKLGNNVVYNNGYNAGFSAGFQDGFNRKDSGGFGWLVSSVQLFIDTKFFGDFGIGTLLYVGLGLTLVTLFLKYFAGG